MLEPTIMIPLALMIAVAEGTAPGPKSLLLDVVFKNTSTETVRLLKRFHDEENLSIWFQLQMLTLDGTPVAGMRGGGKINLRGPLDYVTLGPGETFSFRLNAIKLLTALHPGTYKVSLTYRNQYGQDCFKGTVESNTITIPVPRETPEKIGGRGAN